jgi:hypothetical protein
VDRLSAPSSYGPSKLDLKLDPTLKHTTFSDAKNCRFYPVTVAGQRRKKLSAQEQSSPDNNNKKEDAKFSFINRQEVQNMYVCMYVCMYRFFYMTSVATINQTTRYILYLLNADDFNYTIKTLSL